MTTQIQTLYFSITTEEKPRLLNLYLFSLACVECGFYQSLTCVPARDGTEQYITQIASHLHSLRLPCKRYWVPIEGEKDSISCACCDAHLLTVELSKGKDGISFTLSS